MQLFEMVVWIVAISVIGGVIKSYLDRRKGSDGGGDMMDAMMNDLGFGENYYDKAKIDPYLTKIDALEERVRVLERIATDKGHALAEEINRL